MDLIEKLLQTDIKNKTVVLQFSKVENQIDMFKAIVNRSVEYCRSNGAKFVMFRADAHEQADVHLSVTQYLMSFKEFIPLMPSVFTTNIDTNLKTQVVKHWRRLYAKTAY